MFLDTRIKLINISLENSIGKNKDIIAGVDEVGKGALAGPVVAAAVIFRKKNFSWINRVNDSKLLSKNDRSELSKLIKDNCTYGIGAVSNHVIDQVGIEKSIDLAMQIAIDRLFIEPTIIIIDGFNRKLNHNGLIKNFIKGDQNYLSIAAASIIAKVYRDNILINLSSHFNSYGFDTNVGYGTFKHMSAIKKYGYTTLHRMSFMPIKALIRDNYD
ncbi:MAG: ribonuclease HII [Chloroflexi bacterium]|jgi:ribonuclease HII|nr:MAG: ribonuclease HII [Chloroflexota bacterium]